MKYLYWKLIATHKEEQTILRFMSYIGADPSWKILDVGCGYGRNLKYLRTFGYHPVGVEVSTKIAK